MKQFLFLLSLTLPLPVLSQGLFSYFKLTADDSRFERFDRIVFDLNYDNWDNSPVGVKPRSVSLGVNAYFYKDIPFSKYSNMAFAFGLGVSSHNAHNNAEIVYRVQSDGSIYTALEPFPDGYKYSKNKLSLNYLEIPLELRFRTRYKKDDTPYKLNFRFYPGFKGGVLVGSHTKRKDEDSKVKVYDIKNTLVYRYGPTLRIAFNKISFYGFYSLTPMFEKGKGDEIYQYAAGLSLLLF